MICVNKIFGIIPATFFVSRDGTVECCRFFSSSAPKILTVRLAFGIKVIGLVCSVLLIKYSEPLSKSMKPNWLAF